MQKRKGKKKGILASHPFSKTPKSIDSGKTKSEGKTSQN